jgi:hypothetical protein
VGKRGSVGVGGESRFRLFRVLTWVRVLTLVRVYLIFCLILNFFSPCRFLEPAFINNF